MEETIAQVVNVVIAFLVAVILGFITRSAPLLVELSVQFVRSKLTERQQAALYAAVKVGERAAAAAAQHYNLSPLGVWEQVKKVGLDEAIKYAERFGIRVDREVLEPLIRAEAAKQERAQPIVVDRSFAPPSTDGV